MGDKKDKISSESLITNVIENREGLIPIISDGDEIELNSVEVPSVLSILPLRNTVLFPGVVMPINVGRQKSLQLIRETYSGDKLIGTVTQKEGQIEDPQPADLFQVGTMAEVLKILEMPDGSTSVIIQGKRRFRMHGIVETVPYMRATVHALNDITPDTSTSEFQALLESLKTLR